MVRAAEQRSLPGVANPLDASPFAERLAARFAQLTGVAPILPALRR